MYFSDCYISRQDLYELVWSKPTKEAARILGIPDHAFYKLCKKAEIPRPSAWHWKKLEAGKKEPKTPLMPNDLATQILIDLESKNVADELKPKIISREDEIQFEDIEILKERFEKRLIAFRKPKRLEFVHSEIRRLLAKDDKRRIDIAKGYSWTKLLYDNPFEKRRLKIINSIANILKNFDGSISIRDEVPEKINASLNSRSIEFTIAATNKKQSSETLSQSTPLTLTVLCDEKPANIAMSWQDTSDKKLEDHLTEIVVAIAYAAELDKRIRHRNWIRWRREEKERERQLILKREAEARENTRRQIKAARQAHKDALIDDAKNLVLASELRAYIKHVMELKDPHGENDMMRRWARYVGLQADALDPMKNGRLKSSILHANKSRRVTRKNSAERRP